MQDWEPIEMGSGNAMERKRTSFLNKKGGPKRKGKRGKKISCYFNKELNNSPRICTSSEDRDFSEWLFPLKQE